MSDKVGQKVLNWFGQEWKCTSLGWSVEEYKPGFEQGSWLESKWRGLQVQWSWTIRRWSACVLSIRRTLWAVQKAVRMYFRLWSSKPLTRSIEGVDSSIAVSSASGNQGRAEPKTQLVKPPFVETLHNLHGSCKVCFKERLLVCWESVDVDSFCFLSDYLHHLGKVLRYLIFSFCHPFS